MHEQISPELALILIPALWAIVAYRYWIAPALKKGADK